MDWNEKTLAMLRQTIELVEEGECDGVVLIAARDGQVNSIAAMMPEAQSLILNRVYRVAESIKQNQPLPNSILGPEGEDLRN